MSESVADADEYVGRPDQDLDELDLFTTPPDATALEREPRKCRRHRWTVPVPDGVLCGWCGTLRDPVISRRGKNNRKRGNAAELVTARAIGGRKMGPLGLPWDVEMPGYARLQVKKLERAPAIRCTSQRVNGRCRGKKPCCVVGMIRAIGVGAEMPGVIWIEPGRGGERLIVFRLADFAERHGIPEPDPERDNAAFGVATRPAEGGSGVLEG